MKSISKIYFVISFIVVLLLLAFILFFNHERNKDKLQELRRYAVSDFEKVLAYENANLLSFSLALSEDGALKKALEEENQQVGYELLYSISECFKKNTHIKNFVYSCLIMILKFLLKIGNKILWVCLFHGFVVIYKN